MIRLGKLTDYGLLLMAEIARNPRARSAVLRIAERTAAPLPADWLRGFAP